MNKKTRLLILMLTSFFIIGSISSCKDDPVKGCTDPEAENYNNDADEDDGTCTYARDKFIGNFQANENCTSGNWSWTMNVTESASSVSSIVLQNLGDFGEGVLATVNGDNLSINDTKNGITFSGTGSISGNTLTIIYTASNSSGTDNCTATCIKQ